MFVVVVILFFIFAILCLIFLGNYGMILVSMKVFNVGFFGDFELLLNVWNFLFLILVVVISRRVIVFSLSYINGLMVRNFVFLYLRFVIRIL